MKKKVKVVDGKYICPVCGESRWRSILRGVAYACRNCGFITQDAHKDMEDTKRFKEAKDIVFTDSTHG